MWVSCVLYTKQVRACWHILTGAEERESVTGGEPLKSVTSAERRESVTCARVSRERDTSSVSRPGDPRRASVECAGDMAAFPEPLNSVTSPGRLRSLALKFFLTV